MSALEKSILEDLSAAEDERRLAEAEADIAAGRVVPHAEVAAWLETWGTTEEKSAPAHWFK
jgi:predicted transcriptional regulator